MDQAGYLSPRQGLPALTSIGFLVRPFGGEWRKEIRGLPAPRQGPPETPPVAAPLDPAFEKTILVRFTCPPDRIPGHASPHSPLREPHFPRKDGKRSHFCC